MEKFVELLISRGLLTQAQVSEAKEKQIGAKKPLQDLFVEMGFVAEDALMKILSEVFGMPLTVLTEGNVDAALVRLVPYETARRYGVLPVRREKNVLFLAMSNPSDLMALDDVRALSQLTVKSLLSSKSDIEKCIDKYYFSDSMLYDLLKNAVGEREIDVAATDKIKDRFFETESWIGDGRGPVTKLINFILSDAVKCRASDIHIEPQEKVAKIRYRVDGDLRDVIDIPSHLLANLVARIKVMADLDLAESRKPQDGRTSITARARNIDLRVSTVPTYFGEKVVLRILDSSEAKVQFDRIGFTPEALSVFKQACLSPQGMILVTGPTGSGKTSTLYAALNFIKNETKNIITIEDPVEYVIEGLNQIQVNPFKNVTFATGLKSILRQDPNVILVGEIRDKETAEIAFQASLTGHLVLSTLHTNNAVASITRLIDIGLEPYQIASSLILIVAQRLVKLICPHCKETYTPDQELLERFKPYLDMFGIKTFYKGHGCTLCNFSGYLGRTAIAEVLKIDEKFRSLINEKATDDVLMKEARNRGLKILIESGMERVAQGITTIEAVGAVADMGYGVMAPAQVATSAASKPAGTRILITDDEEPILNVLESRLRGAGYDVLRARNGQEAVSVAMREKPDLIIMDMMMPVMNGLDAVKFLKSKLETAAIPILMLTAKKDVESEVKGFEAGADDYMGKPFDGSRLLARLKMLLRRP